MDSSQQEGVALTAFDPVTADAVVAVLQRAGIAVWQSREPDAYGDVELRVSPGDRSRALAELGRRMEEVRDEVGSREPPSVVDFDEQVRRDPDDPHDGPPLMMERVASMRVLVVALLGPLLVVTVAGPYLPRSARVIVFAAIALGLGIVLARRRS